MGYKVVQFTRRLEVSRQHHTTLAAFAEYADNETGEAGVGLATIAKNTGYKDTKTISRHRKQLVEMGILAVRRGRLPGMKRVVDVTSFPGYQADILGVSGGQNVQVSGGHSEPYLADISGVSGGHSEPPLYIRGEVEEKEQREEPAPARASGGEGLTDAEVEEIFGSDARDYEPPGWWNLPDARRIRDEVAELESRIHSLIDREGELRQRSEARELTPSGEPG